jgi:hypothetical protein
MTSEYIGTDKKFGWEICWKAVLGILRKTIWGWIKTNADVLHVKYELR